MRWQSPLRVPIRSPSSPGLVEIVVASFHGTVPGQEVLERAAVLIFLLLKDRTRNDAVAIGIRYVIRREV